MKIKEGEKCMEEEKKEIRIKLSTVLLIVLIPLIIIVLMGIVIYKLSSENNSNFELHTNTEISNESNSLEVNDENNNNENKNENRDEKFSQNEEYAKISNELMLYNMNSEGTKYIIRDNKETELYETDMDADIFFLKDGSFSAYMTFGNYLSGKYELVNNQYICTISEFVGEYSPVQKTSGKIVFEIIDDSTLKVLESSNSCMLKTTKVTDLRLEINR